MDMLFSKKLFPFIFDLDMLESSRGSKVKHKDTHSKEGR